MEIGVLGKELQNIETERKLLGVQCSEAFHLLQSKPTKKSLTLKQSKAQTASTLPHSYTFVTIVAIIDSL